MVPKRQELAIFVFASLQQRTVGLSLSLPLSLSLAVSHARLRKTDENSMSCTYDELLAKHFEQLRSYADSFICHLPHHSSLLVRKQVSIPYDQQQHAATIPNLRTHKNTNAQVEESISILPKFGTSQRFPVTMFCSDSKIGSYMSLQNLISL